MIDYTITEYGKFPSNWECKTISELQEEGLLLVEDGNHGNNRPLLHEFANEGISYIKAGDISNHQVLFNKALKINNEAFLRIKKGKGQNCDTLITHKGTVGEVAFVQSDNEHPFVCSPQTTFYRSLAPTKIKSEFVYYYLLSPFYQNQFNNVSGESDMAPYVSLTNQRAINFLIPPIEVQQQIIVQLSALVKQINLLIKQNLTLEELAQTLFRKWFIEDVDENWEEKKLDDFFPVITGRKDANFSTENGQYPFFTCSQNNLLAPNYSFEGRAILIAGNGDFNVKRYIGKFEAYQRTYVLIPYEEKYFDFLFVLIKYNLEEITGGFQGSVINFITKGMITEFKFMMPKECDEKLAQFTGIYKKLDFNLKQIQTLIKLRDNILPKLLNGELTVVP